MAGMDSENRSTRRSDEIRHRRMRQSHLVAAAQENAAHPVAKRRQRKRTLLGRDSTSSVVHTPPPVVTRTPLYPASRGAQAGSSLRRSKRNPRRVYNVSLNAQGAEMRLPSLPRFAVSWRLASLSILALMVAALYHLWTAPLYRVEAAEISGLQRLNSGDVNKAIAITGQQVFTLDASQIQQELLADFPEFSSATVQVEIPNRVMITVTERVPVLLWKQDGRLNLVDAEGMTFPSRDGTPLLGDGELPMVMAEDAPPGIAASGAPITSTATLMDQLPAELIPLAIPAESQAKALLSPEMVTAVLTLAGQAPDGAQLTYDAAHGLGWMDRRGWNVFLGDYRDIASKLAMYRAIIEKIKASGSRPALISVEYLYAPYYRLEE